MMVSSIVNSQHLGSAPRCVALSVVSYMPFSYIAMELRVVTKDWGAPTMQLVCVVFAMAIMIFN